MEQSEENCRCCMCGDVGFSDHLLRCPKCHTRSQHTYCSSLYPNIETGKWKCEWCLHKHHKPTQLHSTIKTTTFKKRHRDEGKLRERRDFNSIVNAKKHHLQKQQNESSSILSSLLPRFDSSSSRVAARRYKLLADVLC